MKPQWPLQDLLHEWFCPNGGWGQPLQPTNFLAWLESPDYSPPHDDEISPLPAFFELRNAPDNITAAAQLMAHGPRLTPGQESENIFANWIPGHIWDFYPRIRPIVGFPYIRVGYPDYDGDFRDIIEHERLIHLLLEGEARMPLVNTADIATMIYLCMGRHTQRRWRLICQGAGNAKTVLNRLILLMRTIRRSNEIDAYKGDQRFVAWPSKWMKSLNHCQKRKNNS